MKWKIRWNAECDVCQGEQSIKHLLFECIHVKPLWEVVEKICDFEIAFDKFLELMNIIARIISSHLFQSLFIKNGFCFH